MRTRILRIQQKVKMKFGDADGGDVVLLLLLLHHQLLRLSLTLPVSLQQPTCKAVARLSKEGR